MRVLLTVATKVRGFSVPSGQTRVLVIPNSTTHIEELTIAMDAYRGRAALSQFNLASVALHFFVDVPEEVQAAVWSLYISAATWLIFHEIGHAIASDIDQIFSIKGFALPHAQSYLRFLDLKLSSDRHRHWLDEHSADITASTLLMRSISSPLAPGAQARQHAIDMGWGGGIVALHVFNFPETYDAGRRAVTGEADPAKERAYKTHPPMRFRQACLDRCTRLLYGGINRTSVDPYINIMDDLFSGYSDRHPIPE